MDSPITNEFLRALEAAALAATPGPWEAADWSADDGPEPFTVEAREVETPQPGLASMWPDGIRKRRVAETHEGERPAEDARFIALANPQTILALLAERERLELKLIGTEAQLESTERDYREGKAALRKSEERAGKLMVALADFTKAENSNARRMREAIVEARRRLAKGRFLWNGPCIECDGVLEQALRADNDAGAIARATLTNEATDD